MIFSFRKAEDPPTGPERSHRCVAPTGDRRRPDGGAGRLLEPPGFMMLNYGRGSPLASVVTHVVYGALVGGLAALGH
jgi:hypothetical protein